MLPLLTRLSRAGRARTASLVLLGVVSLQAGWLLAVPAFYGIDEFDHAYRASSVSLGHWGPGRTAPADGRGFLLPVADDVAAAAFTACDGLPYPGRDNCTATTPPDEHGQVLIASAAATYNPVWYAVVGTAARPFEGAAALYAMRVAALVLCDLVLAGALLLLLGRVRGTWAVAGLTVAATPILVYSTVTAAPNALGYCAGILLWVSLLSLAGAPTSGSARAATASVRGPLAGVLVGGTTVMCTHSTGVLWVALSLLCCAPLLTAPVRQRWRDHRIPLLLAASTLALAAVACATWVLVSGTNDPRSEVGDGGFGPAPSRTLLQGLVLWPLQAIATLRLRGDAAPVAVYALGATLFALLLGAALRRGRARERTSLLLVLAASTVVPLVATVAAHDQVGPAWQGRYGLALANGAVVLAVWVLGRGPDLALPLGAGGVVAVAAMHLLTLHALLATRLGGAPPAWVPWAVSGSALLATGALLGALVSARDAPTQPRPRTASLRR